MSAYSLSARQQEEETHTIEYPKERTASEVVWR